MKTPNPKTQISNKHQIDAWDFFGAWGLGLGNLACD